MKEIDKDHIHNIIAAAPDMLEALQTILKVFEDIRQAPKEHFEEYVSGAACYGQQVAELAIAKARGE